MSMLGQDANRVRDVRAAGGPATALGSAEVPRTHFHDLRHTGNTLTAHSGATLSDLMARMGHSSTRAAPIELHTSSDRDVAVAAALDALIHRRPSST